MSTRLSVVLEAPKACQISRLSFTTVKQKISPSILLVPRFLPGIPRSAFRIPHSILPPRRDLLSAFDVAYQCLRQHAFPRFSPDRLPLPGPGRGSISRIAAHSAKPSGSDSETTRPVDRAERPSFQLRGLLWESGLIHFASV